MSKPKDFSQDLADVAETVNSDVDAIIKLVRQKDASQGDPRVSIAPPTNSSDSTASPQDESIKAQPPAPTKMPKQKSRNVSSRNQSSQAEQVALENVTTRLRRDTNELLTEAALRQKLKKEDPSTRQDVIEAALQDWFRRNGYS